VIAPDAETDADLGAIASAALRCPELVLAGSAGLAAAVAARLAGAGSPAPVPRGKAWLIVAGSAHPSTRAQLAALEAAGVPGVRLDDIASSEAPLAAALASGQPVWVATGDGPVGDPSVRRATAARLAGLARSLLSRSRVDLVAVTGGETAIALLRALGAEQIEIGGAPASGLALGDAIAARGSRIPILTKAGGFGPPDLFLTLLGSLRREPEAPSDPVEACVEPDEGGGRGAAVGPGERIRGKW
jgi:uncharacterized protein YgbK (DUF1537 family)